MLTCHVRSGLSPLNRTWPVIRRRTIQRIRSTSNERKDSDEKITSIGQAETRVPQADVQTLRDKVFSLDTFFVQSVENYGENGILFKGNIRQDPSKVQKILQNKIDSELPGYKIFILQDRQDKPTAVVISESSAGFQSSDVSELVLSTVLGISTFLTTLNVYDAEIFNAALLVFNVDLDKIQNALVPALASILILALHELGHIIASKKEGVDLGPPLLLPAGLGLLGSFGSITRIKGDIQSREVLARIIAPGPILGTVASFMVFMLGMILTMNQDGGVELESSSFCESFFVGTISSMFLGDRVFTADSVNCNPLLVVGWGGLIINSINLIPVGELDGGKLSLAVFGRQGSQFVSVLSFLALGIGSFANGLALFWLLLVLSIQRGPVSPCREEISKPSMRTTACAISLLFVPLLVLLPYPAMNNFSLQ